MDKNDLNNAQAVTEQDLNSADSVNQQDLTAQSVTEQNQEAETLADGTNKDKIVKYSELEKATKRAKEAEEKAMQAQRDLELFQANMQGQQQAAQQTQQQAGSTYEQAMQQLDLTADDLYGENILKVNALKDQLDAAKLQYQNAVIANQQFVAATPDFTQVVGSVNPATGTVMSPTAEALALLQRKPYLANAPYRDVYNEVMQARKFKEFEAVAVAEKEHLNRHGVDVKTQPMGGSAAGVGPGGDNQTAQMMTREQSLDIRRRIANGETV